MTQLTITVKSELVRQGLEDLSAELPRIGRRRIRTMLERVKRRMQEYPPEPRRRVRYGHHAILGTVIVKTGRTGRLGSSWAIDNTENGYRISNNAAKRGRPYSKFVVGDAYGTGQAFMHVGRWQKLRDVIDEEMQLLPDEVANEIQTVARREGLAA